MTPLALAAVLTVTGVLAPTGLAAPVPAAGLAVAPQPVADQERLFRQAGAAYEAGRFGEARDGYLRLAAGGAAGPGVYYNLGNASFRLGERGRAILWYERARRLAPRDEDIRFNLALARAALEDEESDFWELADRVLTPRELLWLTGSLFWLVCLGAGWVLWRGLSGEAWQGRLLGAGLALLLATVWLGTRVADLRAPWAAVVRPNVEVRSGPGDQFAVGFTVPEGRRALLLRRRPGWVEIGVTSQSLKGWVPEDSVERF